MRPYFFYICIMNLEEAKKLLKKHNLKGFNEPRLTPEHKTKKAIVLAKKGNVFKLIRFGDQNSGHNYSPAAIKNFENRFRSKIEKGILFAAFWSYHFLWAGKGGSVKQPPKTQKRIFK